MGKRGPKQGEGGRPQREINWQQIQALCAIQCTLKEIVAVTGVPKTTLERACKRDLGQTFGAWCKEKAENGKASLRRRMFKIAENGNATMCIWLSKNWLGYTDKTEEKVTGEHTTSHKVVIYAPDNGRGPK